MKNLRHYFIPHPETHAKAHLLSWHFLLIYILIFLLLRFGIELVNIYKPGVLGINSNMDVTQVIANTNKERQKNGLSPLKENAMLSAAAAAKARNMFEEDYWAHYSPSGKDPWGFILAAGYKFSYAGENLARNFYNADDVVQAWMNSPSHRDNILNSKYEDIGIAVVEGLLKGQKTTLVVQEFGRPYNSVAVVPQVNIGGKQVEVPTSKLAQPQPVSIAGAESKVNQALIDPYVITKAVGISLIVFVAMLILTDLIVLKRRGVFRLSSHHLAHLSFLGITSASVLINKVGEVL